MKPYDSFNPWRGDEKTPGCGFNPADVVGMQPSLTDGQKRLYERLVRFAGRDGNCYPSQARLAELLGKSERQIQRDLKALEEARLIRHRYRDGRRSNTYIFLWHDVFQVAPQAYLGRHGRSVNEISNEFERTSASGQSKDLNGHSRPVQNIDRTDRVALSGHGRRENSVSEFSARSLSNSVDGSTARRERQNSASDREIEPNAFEEFQALYPEGKRCVERETAVRAYLDRISETPGEHPKLMAGLSRHVASTDWHDRLARAPNGKLIPSMKRFISEGMYLDHPPVAHEADNGYRPVPSPASNERWDPITEQFLPVGAVQ